MAGVAGDPVRQQNRPDVSGRVEVCHQMYGYAVVWIALAIECAEVAVLSIRCSGSVPPRGGAGKAGGAEEARTPDPLLAKEVLSQLSYGPWWWVAGGSGRGSNL